MNFDYYNQLVNVSKILSEKTMFNSVNMPCVYFLIDRNEIVYIGQTTHFSNRIIAHKNDDEKVFDSYFVFNCEKDHLDGLESFLIMYHQPVYNILKNEKAKRKFHLPMRVSEIIKKLVQK